MAKRWTDQEKTLLRDVWQSKPEDELENLFGRGFRAIQAQAYRMGLYQYTPRPRIDGDRKEKYCPRCENTLDINRFGSCSSKSDGKQSYCRDCRSSMQKESYSPATREKKRRWAADNYTIYRSWASHDRRAKIRLSTSERFTVQNIKDKWGSTCYLCSLMVVGLVDEENIDHVIPISRGGDNTLDNCRVVHGWCNRSKGDRLVDELDGKWAERSRQMVKNRRLSWI